MYRLFILLLILFTTSVGIAQDPAPLHPQPGDSEMDDIYKDMAAAQKRLRDSYEALVRRMRISAQSEKDEQTKERCRKAIALMDELRISYQMERLAELIESQAANAAMAKAASISEMIEKVLQVMDGIDPDWKPDSRIPTLQEKLEQLKLLSDMQEELQKETQQLNTQSELSEADKLKLEQLKSRQRELQEKARDLADVLPDEVKPLLSEADEFMDQAFDQLQQENTEGAENRQGEAKERLDQAQREIEDQLRKYRDRENETLLLHVERELEKLRAAQVVINKTTIESHLKVQEGERVSRRDWRNIYITQRVNSKEAEVLAEKLLHGNVPIFGHVMKSVGRDMAKAAALLRRSDGGDFTQSIQEDIMARLNDLLDALRAERSRRQNEGGDPPQQTNPDGSSPEPRLVPLPAELGILLKRQEYLRKKHERFMERFPEVKDRANMTDAQRRIYERLSQEQGENAGYLDSLLDTLFNRE